MLGAVSLEERFLPLTMRTLSGGEIQRLSLSIALATRPELLVLDEPLTAADPNTRGRIATTAAPTLERLGIGTLFASQDVELLRRLCPPVMFLDEGRILARGSLDDVLARTEHENIRELAENAPEAVRSYS